MNFLLPAWISAGAELLENEIKKITLSKADEWRGESFHAASLEENQFSLGTQWYQGKERKIVYETVGGV